MDIDAQLQVQVLSVERTDPVTDPVVPLELGDTGEVSPRTGAAGGTDGVLVLLRDQAASQVASRRASRDERWTIGMPGGSVWPAAGPGGTRHATAAAAVTENRTRDKRGAYMNRLPL